MEDSADTLAFGEYTLDLADRRLLRRGVPVDLGSRYFDALVLLAKQPGQLVTKDRFMDEVWRGIPVTDEALTQCIRTLRRTLGDEAAAPVFIETVPKHGYRFRAVPVESAPAAVARSSHGAMAARTAIGGMAAGLVGGAIYGLAALAAGGGGSGGVLVLALLGAALGFLGGAGAGSGAALALGWRDTRWSLVAGAGLGGLAIGAIGSALGLDGVEVIAGARLGRVTGLPEGLLLGLAAGGALVVARDGRVRALAYAAAIGLLAGSLVSLSGGHLFADSLMELERGVAASRIGLTAALSPWRGLLAPVEAALFTTAIAGAQILGGQRKGAAR